ncbi:probable RNA-binding protein 19 [Lethenteron reissneri]|uniref:probable RNA-binding protein 19 n=1 Tax=Lethenteron reissneri TaxID=7753 RepID=UPI002AB72A86|nr:probable RNA-binding protein 19 [Lethenteron reissneri]
MGGTRHESGGQAPPTGAPTAQGPPGPPEGVTPAPDVAETGRLFVRNLPYTCSQLHVEQLFSKHGPLSEVRFPLDTMSGRPKGFAFVGFAQSEDAVRALALLDGSIFQGRMLHVLPALARKEEEEEVGPTSSTSSYKRDKEKRDKASSHNWNALFLGINAVADAMATAYGTSKRRVLDHETEGSAAVRLALGEAEIVTETRRFLEEAGVQLNTFGQSGQAVRRPRRVGTRHRAPPGLHAKGRSPYRGEAPSRLRGSRVGRS